MASRSIASGTGALVAGGCGGSAPAPTIGPAASGSAASRSRDRSRRFRRAMGDGFLPGSGVPLTKMALVTEKGGQLWLVDVASGKKQAVAGVPAVKVAGQGGLGDVVAAPRFRGQPAGLSELRRGGRERDQRRGARLWHA